MTSLLRVENLQVQIGESTVLHDFSLEVQSGKVHALMGRNGSGKSTFARTVAGDPQCKVLSGEICYKGDQNLLDMSIDQRARAGIFLGFQYPVEVAGLTNSVFLRSAYNAMCTERGKEALDALDFDDFLQKEATNLGVDKKHIYRSLNADFSGGEKKRNEMLQMAVLTPDVSILDEIDSGLDIDSLKAVADCINQQRSSDNAVILITHYHRILDYIIPDSVHVLVKGRIATSGDAKLAKRVEKEGYEGIIADFYASQQ